MHLVRMGWLAASVLCGCSAGVVEPELKAPASRSQALVPTEQFRDTFNGANNANGTGLNDNLAGRQSGSLAPATYTRLSGLTSIR
jgi:hypothetical protein